MRTLVEEIEVVKKAYLIGNLKACPTEYLLDRLSVLSTHASDYYDITPGFTRSDADEQWYQALNIVISEVDDELATREDDVEFNRKVKKVEIPSDPSDVLAEPTPDDLDRRNLLDVLKPLEMALQKGSALEPSLQLEIAYEVVSYVTRRLERGIPNEGTDQAELNELTRLATFGSR